MVCADIPCTIKPSKASTISIVFFILFCFWFIVYRFAAAKVHKFNETHFSARLILFPVCNTNCSDRTLAHKNATVD